MDGMVKINLENNIFLGIIESLCNIDDNNPIQIVSQNPTKRIAGSLSEPSKYRSKTAAEPLHTENQTSKRHIIYLSSPKIKLAVPIISLDIFPFINSTFF